MTTLEITHGRQREGTRIRLRVGRLFGLTALLLFALGSNYWSANGHELLEESLFALGILIAVLGFLGRLWCLGYISGRKKRVLVVTEPYSLCRHPLYFCSFLGALGLGLCTETLTAPLLIALAFAIYYPSVIRTEERFLSANFPHYAVYRRRVPAFFPRWSAFVDERDLQLDPRAFRRELLAAGSAIPIIAGVELIEAFHRVAWLPSFFLIP